MNRRAAWIFLPAWFAFAFAAPRMAEPGIISPEELLARLKKEEKITVVMVWDKAHFTHGHIPGARHIPIQELDERRKEIPKDRPVVVYCGCCRLNICPRALPAARKLLQYGYPEVYALDIAGWSSWVAGGFPVETGEEKGRALSSPYAFSAKDFTGEPFRLSAFSGRVLVMAFAELESPHSAAVLAELQRLQKRRRPGVDFAVVLRSAEPEAIAAWVMRHGPTVRIVPETQQLRSRLKIQRYPSLLVFGPDGDLRSRWEGEWSAEELARFLSGDAER